MFYLQRFLHQINLPNNSMNEAVFNDTNIVPNVKNIAICNIILWHINLLLSSDFVNSDRCYVMPATYRHATIQ
jgi:hypothetical protein